MLGKKKKKAQKDDKNMRRIHLNIFQCQGDICRQLSHTAALCFKQRSFQFVITYIWWQKRPLGLLQRPHRKFRASIQDMVGRRDAWNSRLREIGNNYHFDGKRLKLSCSNIPGMPKSKTYQGRGQGKRKCIVLPRLHFRSYYINVIDNTVNFFKLLKNTF